MYFKNKDPGMIHHLVYIKSTFSAEQVTKLSGAWL